MGFNLVRRDVTVSLSAIWLKWLVSVMHCNINAKTGAQHTIIEKVVFQRRLGMVVLRQAHICCEWAGVRYIGTNILPLLMLELTG